MIKVTHRQRAYSATGTCSEEMKVIEHEKGEHAQVYNGVLTVYTDFPDVAGVKAIAGYMPDSWTKWEKA